MSEPIQTHTLRAYAGWNKNRVASLWLPTTTDEGYKLPHRYASLLEKGKKQKKVKRNALNILTTDLGLSKSSASLFLSRRISDIERTEEEIKAVVDNLLLCNPEFFRETLENKTILFGLLRKIIKVSTFNVDQVTKDFKSFANFVWMEKTKALTIETPDVGRYNIFRPLLNHSIIRSIDLEKMDKSDLAGLAHLTSTRNFVSGGYTTMRKSLEKFESTTSVEFNSTDVYHPFRSAKAVGKKVKGWMKSYPTSAAHVSLNSAGSYESPSSEGGRFIEINNDLRLVLNEIPKETRQVNLPLGFIAQDVENVPRWKTWARDVPITAEAEFGTLITKLSDFYEEIRYWGFDEALGNQIFLVALYIPFLMGYIDIEGNVLKDIPARTIAVPEPGGKSRVVTTSYWWVIILQQPGGHTLKELLKLHPSAESGMERTDQAWNYISLLRRVEDADLSQYELLSSDLEEATDALDPRVVKDQVEGFMSGIGVSDPLVSLGLKLVTSGRLIVLGNKVFEKRRGILMGEPMTKACLTLYNLCVEEKAIREYLFRYETKLNVDEYRRWFRKFHTTQYLRYGDAAQRFSADVAKLRKNPGSNRTSENERIPKEFVSLIWERIESEPCEWYKKPVQVTWRAFHVGGDDHLALGPREYLEGITHTHLSWGSKISKPKHGISRLAVKYCEKVLALKGRNHKLSEWDINSSTENYIASVWVDSVKVRLLSPISKSIEVQNDHNIAIGKAISLGKTLRWLNPDFFSERWVRMVRERFFKRMKGYLPKEGTALYYQILLPQKLGGLDLYLKGEIPDIFWMLPRPSQRYLQLLLKGEATNIQQWQMSSFVTTDIERGVDTNESLLVAIQRDAKWPLIQRGFGIESQSLRDARVNMGLTHLNMRQTLSQLRLKGWLTFDNVLDLRQRPRLFQAMLLQTADTSKKYRTMSWKRRYSFLWDLLNDEGFSPDHEFLNEALKGLERVDVYIPIMVYNVKEETDGPFVNADGRITIEDCSFEEEVTRMLPDLSLKNIRNHVKDRLPEGDDL